LKLKKYFAYFIISFCAFLNASCLAFY